MKVGIEKIRSPFVTTPYIVKKYLIGILLFFFSQQILSQAPTIASFVPGAAASGTIVTITGTNFTGATGVSFGGTGAASFTIVSSTIITAQVGSGTNGSITVFKGGLSGTRTGFYYLPLSRIITDFAGYWSSTTANNNTNNPDDGNNLLAFTYNGINYSTGVNDNILIGQGIGFSPGRFKSLPVANIAGSNVGSSIYLAMASKADGNASVADASAVSNLTVRDVLTDGINGLNMGTGFTNLPTTALMTFDIHIVNPDKILDAEPDILITQIASPSSGNDVFQFVNQLGITVGNIITQDMTQVTKLGTYSLDLFYLSPGASFNSAKGYKAFDNNTTRDIRVVAFKLSDFGITNGNYTNIAALKITPSGTSDYAFIAFNANAIEMAPNISQNLDKTNSSICGGGTANLEVIASAAYGGALTYSWEQSVNGGLSWTSVTNGGSFSGANTKRLSISSAIHNYLYRASVTEAGTGFTSVCENFTISIISPTTPTSVTVASTAATTCSNNLVSLSAKVTGGSNWFYQWQSNVSGSYQDIPDANLFNYIPPVSATGPILYRVYVSSGSGCSGGKTSDGRSVTVVGISSTTPASRCGIGVVSLTVAATSGTINWYAASKGGSSIATGTNYSPSIAASTTFYVATDVTQCLSAGRVPVQAIINTVTWTGNSTTEWSTLANWDCGGVPAILPGATNNIRIPTAPTGNRFPVISTLAAINNITIASGASTTVETGGTFEIYGAINNSGTLNATNGTISMRGTTQQSIPANVFGGNSIKNLIINNASGVLLGGVLNITGTYTPTSGTLTTFGFLTLKSTMNGTARVAAGSGNYVIGNVNVERYIPARRSWRMLTAPITNSNTIFQSWQNGGVYALSKGMLVTGPSPSPANGLDISYRNNASIKRFDNSTQQFVSLLNTKVSLSPGSTGSADNGGYFVFVRGDRDPNNIDPNGIIKNITILTATGYLQTGTQRFTNLSSSVGGFSIVGNPYASPIDLNLILSNAGTSNIKRKFYVWDPELNLVGGYVVMDDVVTPGSFSPSPTFSTQTNDIQSGQAFFAITNLTGNAVVEIRESNKSDLNNTKIFGRPAGITETFIANLNLLNTADGTTISADGIRADFNPAFAPDIDDFDNLKCINTNETFGLLRNNFLLATERRPALVSKDTLFFNLAKTTKRSYQFKFIGNNVRDPTLIAMLEDSYTKIPIPLNLFGTTEVNFVINNDLPSQATNRFKVVFGKASILPVTFLVLKAYPKNEKILVEWSIENEMNIGKYEVERSDDGNSFRTINTTPARGNNLSVVFYNWVDGKPSFGNIFYRIKSTGLDGAIQYSQVVKVSVNKDERNFSVFPNPISERVMQIQFIQQPIGTYTVKLTNNSGQLLLMKELKHQGGTDTKMIDLPTFIQTGNYQVVITSADFTETSFKVVVQ